MNFDLNVRLETKISEKYPTGMNDSKCVKAFYYIQYEHRLTRHIQQSAFVVNSTMKGQIFIQ